MRLGLCLTARNVCKARRLLGKDYVGKGRRWREGKGGLKVHMMMDAHSDTHFCKDK